MLTVKNLRAGYGKLIVLRNVSLRIDEGQFVAILGPNGSGKSTLLKSIFGLATIFDGDIQLHQKSLVDQPTELIGTHGIAYVPQRENVFASMTVRENLMLAVRNLQPTAAQAALDDAYTLFPILPQRDKQRTGLLSGGERQMLAIAIGWLAPS
ncbi:ATP-binding cassette domain-containing protein [Chloroflexi bacterium TSY]|nr:ATP-binding cassette domain-containing protein [Chloroflexi bacterium TSY]